MIKYCSFCNQPFQSPPSSHRKICSKECAAKSRENKYVEEKCPICGVKYKRLREDVKRGEFPTCRNKNCVKLFRSIILNFPYATHDYFDRLSDEDRTNKISEFKSILYNKKNKQWKICGKPFLVKRGHEKLLTCSTVCSEILRSQGATKSNINRSEQSQKNRFKPRFLVNLIRDDFIYCVKCQKPFKNEFNLGQHYFQAHIENQESNCNICGKPFKSLKSLLAHCVETHKISAINFYVDKFFNGVRPKCKCGCGQHTSRIHSGGIFRKYIKGHAPLKNQRSMLENVFYRLLNDVFVDVRKQYRTNQKWPVDFYIRDIDTFIEFDGIFWHGKISPQNKIDNDLRYIGVKRRIQIDLDENEWFKKNNLNFVRISDRDFINNNFKFVTISGCDRITDQIEQCRPTIEKYYGNQKIELEKLRSSINSTVILRD